MVRAAVVREPGAGFSVEEIELTEPGPGQVRVRLTAAGVCHSDLSVADGTFRHDFPVVLGHEGAGRVVATGPGVDHVSPGDPVLLIWQPPCGACWFCVNGDTHLCEHATDAWARPYARLADGTPVYPGLGTASFGEETVVPAGGVVAIPDDIPLTEAPLLGCAVLTGIGAVLNTAGVRPGESVVVIGLGGIGLSVVQGARLAGADPIIAVDVVPEKAERALSLGATHALRPGDRLAAQVRGLTAGRGADHAFECAGRGETLRLAWSTTRRGGQAILVGVGGDTVTFGSLELFHFARTIKPCVYGSFDPARDLPCLFGYLREGRPDLAGMVTARVGLAELPAAFAAMRRGHGACHLVVSGD